MGTSGMVASANSLATLAGLFGPRTPGSDPRPVHTRHQGHRHSLLPRTGVPGNVAGWLTLQGEYGKLDPAALFGPAIEYAESGTPVTFNNHRQIVKAIPRLLRHPETSEIVLNGDEAPGPGARLKFSQLAASLRLIAQGGMTTHFAIADSDGNVVSITQTLGGAFGAAVAMGDTGIFPNNMAYWFDLEAGSPNRIGPGKKVDFVLAPTQTFSGDRFFLSIGTPGSWGIMQTTPQMLVNVLDHGMTVQQAIDAPRFRVYTGKRVEMEDRFPASLRTDLEQRGHDIDLVESWSMNVGGGQAIAYDHEASVFHGGADPRRDGVAMGY